jgi:peptidoglycan-associated lipoprotein
MKLRILGLVVVGMVSLYGCAKTQTTKEETPPPTETPTEEKAPAATTEGADTGAAAQVDPLAEALSKKVFYFPFDSSDVSAADREILAAHAQVLAGKPGMKVVVEGHADERGSREYNLALGERRAQSVQRLLTVQGAKKGQAKSVTFGEERPTSDCHDESCWSQNRRVELQYSGE